METSRAELIHESTAFTLLDESAQNILTEKDVKTNSRQDQFVSKKVKKHEAAHFSKRDGQCNVNQYNSTLNDQTTSS